MMFINMDNYFKAHEGAGKFDVVKQAGARVSELTGSSDDILPLQTARGKKITSQVLNEILGDDIIATVLPKPSENMDAHKKGEK